MKIDPTSPANERIETGRKKTGQPPQPSPTPRPDEAAVSPELRAVLKEDAGRSTRIEKLREAVSSGAYQPDVHELARKLVDATLGDSKD
jgi:anti-sigma28 factor (negative regulator of flagellin synthesis)